MLYYYEHAIRFGSVLGLDYCWLIEMQDMLNYPDDVFGYLAKKIGVEPKFDTSKIIKGGNWTTQMFLDVLRQDPKEYMKLIS